MKLSRAPTSRSVRITCPFAAIAARAASPSTAASATAISPRQLKAKIRSRSAVAISGCRQAAWSS